MILGLFLVVDGEEHYVLTLAIILIYQKKNNDNYDKNVNKKGMALQTVKRSLEITGLKCFGQSWSVYW